MNNTVQVFWVDMFPFLLGVYLGVELQGHVVNVGPFEDLPGCFPERLHPLSLPSTACEGFSFSASSPTHIIFKFLPPSWL